MVLRNCAVQFFSWWCPFYEVVLFSFMFVCPFCEIVMSSFFSLCPAGWGLCTKNESELCTDRQEGRELSTDRQRAETSQQTGRGFEREENKQGASRPTYIRARPFTEEVARRCSSTKKGWQSTLLNSNFFLQSVHSEKFLRRARLGVWWGL